MGGHDLCRVDFAKVLLKTFARLAFADKGGGLALRCAPDRSGSRMTSDTGRCPGTTISRIRSAARPGSPPWVASSHGRTSRMFVRCFVSTNAFSSGSPVQRVARTSHREDLVALPGSHPGDHPVGIVTLRTGSRLIVELNRVEAFTSGIHFRTIVSARLSAFSQGRLFYTEACFSGSIMLSGKLRVFGAWAKRRKILTIRLRCARRGEACGSTD